MRFLKYLALTLVTFIIVVGVVGIFLPNAQHVERQITIAAPAKSIFPYVNDFRKFNEWSPWAALDPNTQYTFSGPDSGTGAKIEWKSEHKQVGEGSQEIMEAEENVLVKSKLDIGMGSPALASFSLNEADGETTLIWGFDAQFDSTISRYFGLIFDLEKWVGDDYEEGLSRLKRLIESA